MDYKVLVRLYVPEIEQEFDMYIPINRTVGQALSLLNKAVSGETFQVYPIKPNLSLVNKKTFQVYKNDTMVRETDIKNGTELVMI